MTRYKTETNLPADVYSQFYEEVGANPEGAMLFIAGWARTQALWEAADAINKGIGELPWDFADMRSGMVLALERVSEMREDI